MTSEGRGVGSFKFQIAILLNTICSHWRVYCVLKSPYPITNYLSLGSNVSGFCIRRSLPTAIATGNLSFIPDMLYSQIQSGLYLTLSQPYVQTCDGRSKEEKMDWFVHHYVFSYHLANQRYWVDCIMSVGGEILQTDKSSTLTSWISFIGKAGMCTIYIRLCDLRCSHTKTY